ncbi:MAG: J domain-containing protein [Duganella sp.]
MGKIHTHYDNLKVSRMAPQEVIRAAYKALSQKYHPDKNPGDEKAARIMAIVNSAYDSLSDPLRRKEHDEWIAAEEWEIAWLESTRHEDGRSTDKSRQDNERWYPEPVADSPRERQRVRATRWKWGGALVCGLLVGWLGGAMMAEHSWLEKAWGLGIGPAQARVAQTSSSDEPAAPAVSSEVRDPWAVSRHGDETTRPLIKVVAMSQVVLPSAAGECDIGSGSGSQPLVAPNGEPWPRASGYLDGFSVGNRGDDMQLMLDNASNASAVFIKVYDVDRRANVRYAYVQAHDKLMVDQLANGKYEIRYQNLDNGAACNTPSGGSAPRRTAATERALSPTTFQQ